MRKLLLPQYFYYKNYRQVYALQRVATYLKIVQTLLLTGTKARAKNTMAAISIRHCSSLLLARFNRCRYLHSLFWMVLRTWAVHTADCVIVHYSISIRVSII